MSGKKSFKKGISSLGGLSSVHSVLDSFNKINSIQSILDHMDYTRSVHKMLDSMDYSRSFQKMMSSFDHIGSIQKTLDSVAYASSAQKMIDSMDYSKTFQKMMSSIGQMSSIQKVLDSLDYASSVQKMLSSMDYSKSFQKMIDSFDHMSSVQKILDSIDYSSSAKKTLDALSKSTAFYDSIVSLTKADYFNSAIASLSLQNISVEGFALSDEQLCDPDKLGKEIEKVANTEDASAFFKFFTKLPAIIQIIVVFCFLQIVGPVLNNIAANLITPHVEKILFSKNLSNKEKVGNIKKIKIEESIVELERLRFISGDNVRLRAGPSTKTKILNELTLGQVVTVISKKHNWIEVEYEDEDGEYFHGWVFTRYTAKFKS